MQCFQAAERVVNLKERAIFVMSRTFVKLLGADIKKYNHAISTQMLPIFLCQHHPPTCSHYDVAECGEFLNDLALATTEAGLSFYLENGRNIDPRTRHDFVIGIDEAPPQAASQLAPDGGFPGSHETDQVDILRIDLHWNILPHRNERRPAKPAFVHY